MRFSTGCRLLFACTALGAAQASAGAEDAVRGWLDRMSHALNNLDYQGTFVYQHDGQLESIRVVHIVNDKGEHERLFSLNGTPREVIRTPEAVRCILPDEGSVVLDRQLTRNLFPALPAGQAGDLERYYRFSLVGRDRVAGLHTRVIGIEPKDKYRYGYRLWLEMDTGMLLRSELVDHGGAAIEQVMFTSISLGDPIPMAALDSQLTGYKMDFGPRPPTPPVQVRKLEPEAEDASHDLQWEVVKLPPGFHLKSHGRESLARQDTAEHMVFTDGLASVSVYVEGTGEGAGNAPDGVSKMGAINAFSHKRDGHRVTVVGEVPPVTVRSIATSVRHQGDELAADD